MKSGCLFVDGIDVYEEYGVYIVEGGYNELIAWPSLKNITSNDWQEEDGIETDLDAPVLDTHDVNIDFAVVGEYSSMFNFLNLISDEAYHTFECVEIGRTFKLRLVSSGSLKTLKILGKLKLKFADDFPMDGYEYQAPASTLPENDNYLLDDVPLSSYGVRVLQGTYDEISNPATVKENLLRNLSQEEGAEYDQQNVTYQSKDVKLTCLVRGENLEALWRNYLALLHDLIQPGERVLYVTDFEQDFPFYYRSCKVKEFMAKDVPWLKFEVNITFTRDFRIEDDDILLATEDFILVFTEDEENAIDMKPIRGGGSAGVTTYGTPRITSVTYDDIPLTGGTVTPTIRFTQSWTDADGNTGTLNQDTTDYEVKYLRVGAAEGVSVDTETGAVSTENANEDTSRKAAAAVAITITANGKTSNSKTVNVYQAANERTWDIPVVLSLAYDDIPNSGGTVTPTMAFYQRWTDALGNSGQVNQDTTDYTTYFTPTQAIEGVTVNSTTGAVTAQATETQERTAVVMVLCQVTANGKTSGNTSSAATTTVYQESAAVRTYERPVITKFTYDDISADGGASLPTLEFTQEWTDTDGNSGTLTQDTTDYSVAYTALGLITGTSINTTTGEVSMSQKNDTAYSRQVASIQAIVTANGQESVLHIAYVTQEKGEVTYTYSTPSVTTVYNGYLSNEIGDTISPSILVTQTREGSDGSSTVLYLQPGEYDVSFNANDSGGLQNATLNTSTGVITCIAANSTVETLQIGLVNTNVTANGKSGSTKTNVYQAAGDVTYEYSDPEVSLSYPYAMNTGGTVSPTYSYTLIRTGNDGSSTIISDGGEVSFTMPSYAEGVTIDPDTGVLTFGANTYDSIRTLATVDITVKLNGKSGGASTSVTQIARTYSDVYTWSDMSLTYPEGENTASSISPTLSYKLTRTRTYSDGTVETTEWTEGASVAYSMSAVDHGTSIDSETGVVSFQANTSDSRRNLGSVTATLSLDGQTVTVGNFVYQAARTYEDSYSTPTASISYATAMASDRTAAPTYSYSQTRTRTYSDGTVGTSTLTSGATLGFQTQQSITDVTINAETGDLGFPVNPNPTERRICYVLMDVTMNGETTQVSCEVRQAALDFTAPVVDLDSTIYQETTGSGTMKIYFNIDTTYNDASYVYPSYFIGASGEQYEVQEDRVRHETSSSSGYYTNYSVEVPYNGSNAFTTSPLYTSYKGTKSSVDFEGDVTSTKRLVNSSGTFQVR